MQSINIMNSQKDNELRKRIIEEMVVNHANALTKNLDLAKKFIGITRKGNIDILFKDKLSGKEQILLYLIGKLYAKKAGFSETDEVGNKELMNELGFPKGSLDPWIKELRDKKKIKQMKKGRFVYHTIPLNLVEKTLKIIGEKLKKGD